MSTVTYGKSNPYIQSLEHDSNPLLQRDMLGVRVGVSAVGVACNKRGIQQTVVDKITGFGIALLGFKSAM